MEKYFGIPIEFNRQKLEQLIEEYSVNTKAYCCFVDSFVLVTARKRESKLMYVLNEAQVNACDGSYIAMFASRLYKKKYVAYPGPEFFSKYIYSPDSHCIIGNTPEVFKGICRRLESEGYNSKNLFHINLPFSGVDLYDYQQIADQIKAINPRYMWVSLGAPKQEIFMNHLLPYIDRGMMLGVGAALNYFSGEIRNIPRWAIRSHTIWIYRIFTEPEKQIKRSFFILQHYFEIYIAERRGLLINKPYPIREYLMNELRKFVSGFSAFRKYKHKREYTRWLEENSVEVQTPHNSTIAINPVPHYLKQLTIAEYQKKYKCNVLIETGTYLGDMVEAQKNNFRRLYSIELSDDLCQKATKRFRKIPHIAIIQGDSGKVLPNLLPEITEPAIFWLDGHYSEGITAQGEKECPVFEELNAILSVPTLHPVILIDDARCYTGVGDYPTIAQIKSLVHATRPEYDLEVKNDIIHLTLRIAW